ncbi:hypothetical protein FXB41_26365 [Bradyrhizobium canariense]|uniref:hypothetical protein n=1 Tax=Bradyrhizobium canariense TaxID=255045 RepID=UPI001CA5DD48|nr:hypothetical protein [Bradyrhizobium canariense]MBW5438158.1 hypothetical protein [Bradyrhizobium canariense]
MPTLYLDHSIITHPASWTPVDDVLTAGKVQLALSLWNLFEIGSASDRAQQDQRLAFLMKAKPLWILERVQIERREVRAFLWKQKLQIAPEPVDAFRRHLSEVESFMVGSQTRIGVTPRQWIDTIDFKRYAPSKELAPTALRQLQTLGPKKVAERQDEIFEKWIHGLLPTKLPDGSACSKAELLAFSKFCLDNQAAFYAACPAMAVENALTRARTATASRIPQNSDGIDLMHAVVALAYCDYFLLRDGFVFQCCEHARKELAGRPLAAVFRDAEDLKKALP